MIFVESRRKKNKTLRTKYPYAKIIDLTSKSDSDFKEFSPFYPHGGIPVPFSNNIYSYSVEGIWQGLKVFENIDVDLSKFSIQTMKGIKRTTRVYGRIKGHRKGLDSNEILDYKTARREIFIKSYFWVLKHKLNDKMAILIDYAKKKDLVFLDYETNTDLEDLSKPISHAGLVKLFIDNSVDVYRAPFQTSLDF